MSYKQFSSRDFGKTRPALNVEMPAKLIHKNVIAGVEADFSRERKHLVAVVDLPSRTMSMTLGGLEPAQRTGRHRHSYETIIYVVEGTGTTVIEDQNVDWSAGDAIYVPVWAWHHHINRSPDKRCLYLACENAPLLQNLGSAIREEAPEK